MGHKQDKKFIDHKRKAKLWDARATVGGSISLHSLGGMMTFSTVKEDSYKYKSCVINEGYRQKK